MDEFINSYDAYNEFLGQKNVMFCDAKLKMEDLCMRYSSINSFFRWNFYTVTGFLEMLTDVLENLAIELEEMCDSQLMDYLTLVQVSKNKGQKGYVYLAYCDTGHYKIGVSKKPDQRIKHFDTQMPVEITKVYTFYSDDCYRTESILHKRFEMKRHKGEWFNLDDHDIRLIKTIGSFQEGFFVHSKWLDEDEEYL